MVKRVHTKVIDIYNSLTKSTEIITAML